MTEKKIMSVQLNFLFISFNIHVLLIICLIVNSSATILSPLLEYSTIFCYKGTLCKLCSSCHP